MKYFDTHVHFFPDQLAGKALPKLREISKCETYSDGTRQGTVDKLAAWGCCGGMVLHIATNAHQQTSVNNFAQESQHDNLYCFGSVYPFADNALEELDRVKELGLYGIKLHPDYQEFMVADPKVLPIYAKAEQLGLPIAFHTGRDPLSPNLVHCPPDQLAKVADMFPKLTIIAAHMGGMDMPQEAAKHLAGKPNVYFDTAFASHFLTSAQLGELIQLHGADRVLFATDCPWSTVPAERELLLAAGLSPADLERVAYRNAEELFGITV